MMFTFRAMNTEVLVSASSDEPAVAQRVFADFSSAERRFSRFDAASELARLNRSVRPFVASPELFDMLVRARSHCEATRGIFDPAVGSALLALGYDRSFAPGALDGAATPLPCPGRFLDVELDHARRLVRRPANVQIDLGGLVKGATVDRAVAHLHGSGTVVAGGDAFVRGTAPDGDAWLVEIEDPTDSDRTIAIVAATNTGVATSADNRRRWRRGSSDVHHLIDPRTQWSVAGDLRQVTVFAPTTEHADVLAKTAFILGAREGRVVLERAAARAVFVTHAGGLEVVGTLDMREVSRA